jgi:hypothetical protein
MKLDKLLADILSIADDLETEGIDIKEVDVLAGIQPTYPLTTVVVGVVSGEELSDHIETGLPDPERKAVWLATTNGISGTSSYNPYAPKALWEVVR